MVWGQGGGENWLCKGNAAGRGISDFCHLRHHSHVAEPDDGRGWWRRKRQGFKIDVPKGIAILISNLHVAHWWHLDIAVLKRDSHISKWNLHLMTLVLTHGSQIDRLT